MQDFFLFGSAGDQTHGPTCTCWASALHWDTSSTNLQILFMIIDFFIYKCFIFVNFLYKYIHLDSWHFWYLSQMLSSLFCPLILFMVYLCKYDLRVLIVFVFILWFPISNNLNVVTLSKQTPFKVSLTHLGHSPNIWHGERRNSNLILEEPTMEMRTGRDRHHRC